MIKTPEDIAALREAIGNVAQMQRDKQQYELLRRSNWQKGMAVREDVEAQKSEAILTRVNSITPIIRPAPVKTKAGTTARGKNIGISLHALMLAKRTPNHTTTKVTPTVMMMDLETVSKGFNATCTQ